MASFGVNHLARSFYRLAVQTGSTAHFALTEVTVEAAAETVIEVACPPDVLRGWTTAVVAGVEAALAAMSERGILASPVKANIVRFVGMPTDTDDEDAFAASYMAAVRAALGESAPLELSPSGRTPRWRLEWRDTE